MKKYQLLKYFDDELMEKLFGFCYSRTSDSHEAEELCSDIIYALLKAANTDGEISEPYAFIWRVARNVYADFSHNRRIKAQTSYDGDADEIFAFISDEDEADNSDELLRDIYRRIAFLTRAYREVMIMYYIDGISSAEIAKLQKISESAVRQRLFSARQKIKSEVNQMEQINKKPLALEKIAFGQWGTGNPGWGDPSEVINGRTLPKHIIWLCRNKAMSASEIAEELNVPVFYVEEELELLKNGKNGNYGYLRRMDNGKYAINFILFDKETLNEANALYEKKLPRVCDIICDFINAHKDEYLSFPYLNKSVDMNLILWQQISNIGWSFASNVKRILKEDFFCDIKETAKDRPYSIFYYEYNGKSWGGGCDGIHAANICGFSEVHFTNIYISRIKAHFRCGHNISTDGMLQFALRAINGLPVSSLSEDEKEGAAKAIECGYLYRDNDMLYTKILAHENGGNVFEISAKLNNGYFEKEAYEVAEKLAELIRKAVPEHLMGEWRFANSLASMPIIDTLVETLIGKGILIPPEDGIGAEGCWFAVKK